MMQQHSNSPTEPSAPPVIVVIDPDVTFSKREYGGHTSYVVHHQRVGKYYRFGGEEYHVALLLDGQRSVNDIHDQITADGLDWSAADVARFIGQLVQGKIAGTVTPAATQPSAAGQSETAQERPQPQEKPAVDVWNRGLPIALSKIISQRIPLTQGDAVAAKFQPLLGRMFSRWGYRFWLLLVTSGMWVMYSNFADFSGELTRLFDVGIWPLLVLIWCGTKVLHEIGHAVCARRHGVRVGKMGVMFFLLAPLAYVDVTDAWKLKRRLQRVQIALAGVYLELALAAVAAWLWWMLPTGFAKHLMAQIFVVAGPATLLVNANPLLRLDGYYVLSDLLEIPNLRMHGRRQLAGRIEWGLFGITQQRSLLFGWRQLFATVHAACSVIFQFFWMGGLILAASMWIQGLGIILAIAAFLLWGLLPLCRWVHKIWMIDEPSSLGLNRKRIGLLGYATMVVLAIQYFGTSASPLARRVPVVVRYQDEQIARASADAFVHAVYAGRGQRVEAGMLLIELRQPELQVHREQLHDDWELAQQRSIQFRRQGRISEAASETEKAASLQRQTMEIDQQLSGLRVFAERDGLITTAYTERLQGVYVHQGEELIRVSDPNEKELLVTVDPSNTEAFQQAVGSIANVRLRGGKHLTATPTELRPRARRSLPHPALAATVGGPLAVEPSTSEAAATQLVQPYLESIATLDPIISLQVRAGQLGTMTIADNRPLVARLIDSLRPQNR